ncbi:MAG: DNA polymerase IV [Spartobacteria bacterium]|nr:DNA polymerase IV [Spartobacteria bacterium]
MTEERIIVHVDMDAFYAAVEQRDHPEYRGKPVIIGSPPDRRGVVSTCSYEARRFGVKSAMPSSEAGRRCPQGIFVSPDMKRYAGVSRQMFAVFEQFSPFVEPLSIDEAFIDLTGSAHLFGGAVAAAELIKKTIFEQLGLTCSVGLAWNKFLAKLASDMNKPDGLTVVPQDVIPFLAALPVQRIWGVGKTTAKILLDSGLETIDSLQRISLPALSTLLGQRAAVRLKQLAQGLDDRGFELETDDKSMSREVTFSTDEDDLDVLHNTLLMLVDHVAGRLRKSGKYAGGIQIKLRWKGFETLTRQSSFSVPVADVFTLMDEAKRLFDRIPITKAVRLIGFGVYKLSDTSWGQMDLFQDEARRDKREHVSHTVDAIRDRFGKNSIRVGWNTP